MNKPTLYLLDAYALIYRAYFALNKNPRITSKGLNTSAVMGFLNTLYEVIRDKKPTHIGVAFDLGKPTERTTEFTDYKANREAMPEDLRASLPYIIEIIKGFNIPIYMVEGYEADDIIGTLAKKAERQGFTTYMMTLDKDFGQLVSDNIFIYKPAKFGEDAKVVGVAEVCEKYGIQRPEQLIDILGLWGDAVDNIPGIPGIGEKTASKLISEYGSMENIFAHTDDLKGKMRENVINFREQGEMSKLLATININVPVTFDAEELKIKAPDMKKLGKIFEELEFRTFMRRMTSDVENGRLNIQIENKPSFKENNVADLFSVSETKKTKEPTLFDMNLDVPETTEHDFKIIDNQDDIKNLISDLSRQKEIGFYVISSGIAFSTKDDEAFFVRLSNDEEWSRRSALIEDLFNNDGLFVTHDLKSAVIALRRLGIVAKSAFFDVMIAHYLIEPEQRHTLEYLSQNYLNHVPAQAAGEKSCCENARLCLELLAHLRSDLAACAGERLFNEVEMPLIEVLAQMEENGVKIDSNNLALISTQESKEIAEIEQKIFEYAGTTFNIASPKQLGDILFEKMGIKAPNKKTKTGQYPTGEEILQKITDKHPIIQQILDYRAITKLKSTYVDALPALVSKSDGLLHTSYNQAVTATGRLSSTNPNLQNIPVRTDKGKEIRKAFVPRDENHILLAADYSQIELRIIAHLSNDEAMCNAFRKGIDIHADTASRVFKIDIQNVTKDMRRKAKAVNFGIIYGISAFGLSEQLGIPRKEAAEIIDNYFNEYAGIKSFIDKAIDSAREKGYVETMLGRRRYLRDINSSNSVVRSFAERNAVNAPIQGSSADMIKIAMRDIHNELIDNNLKSKMILQVHDELVFDVTLDEVEKISAIVKDKMENAIPLSIPVVVEISTGRNWLEAH